MKISDLLCEAITTTRKRAQARTVHISNSWDQTWQSEHKRYGDLAEELRNFLMDKCYYDPPPPHGKKDYLFSGNIALLKGIGHAHMHFGKVVIIYEVTHNDVRLYVAGDHKIVESGGLPDLGRTVKRLKNMPWSTMPTPEISVLSDVSEPVIQAVNEWLAMLMSEPAKVNDLHKFAQNDKMIVPLIPYMSWEPMLKDLTVHQLQSLVTTHLKQS